RIPQWDDRQRDESTVTRTRAPFVDRPVVVGLYAQHREFLVLPLEEGLPAETGQDVGEVDGCLDVIGVHILEPVLLLPTPRPDVVEGDGLVVEIGEPTCGGQLR